MFANFLVQKLNEFEQVNATVFAKVSAETEVSESIKFIL